MEQIFEIKLTLNQINVIVGALGKQPLENVLDVFTLIRGQVTAQSEPPKDPPKDNPSA